MSALSETHGRSHFFNLGKSVRLSMGFRRCDACDAGRRSLLNK